MEHSKITLNCLNFKKQMYILYPSYLLDTKKEKLTRAKLNLLPCIVWHFLLSWQNKQIAIVSFEKPMKKLCCCLSFFVSIFNIIPMIRGVLINLVKTIL